VKTTGFGIDCGSKDEYSFECREQEDGTWKVVPVDGEWRILPFADVAKTWQQMHGEKTFASDREAEDFLYYEFRSTIEDLFMAAQEKVKVTEKHYQVLRDLYSDGKSCGELYSEGEGKHKTYYFRRIAHTNTGWKISDPARKVPKKVVERLIQLYWLEEDADSYGRFNESEGLAEIFGTKRTFYQGTEHTPVEGMEA
jgi:hypothetical protein